MHIVLSLFDQFEMEQIHIYACTQDERHQMKKDGLCTWLNTLTGIGFDCFCVYVILQDMQASKLLGDEAASMYERAVTGLMKHSMLLYFAYADFEEVKKNVC